MRRNKRSKNSVQSRSHVLLLIDLSRSPADVRSKRHVGRPPSRTHYEDWLWDDHCRLRIMDLTRLKSSSFLLLHSDRLDRSVRVGNQRCSKGESKSTRREEIEPDALIVLLTWVNYRGKDNRKYSLVYCFSPHAPITPRRTYKLESTGVLPRLEVRGHAWRSRLSPPSFLGFLGPLFLLHGSTTRVCIVGFDH